MTTPTERSRSVIQAGAFLKELRTDRTLPDAVRNEANRLLRHFPSVSDVDFAASLVSPSAVLQNPFGGPAESDWWESYSYGPVKGNER